MLKKSKLPLTNAPEFKVVPPEPVLPDADLEKQNHFPTAMKTLVLGIVTIVLIGGGVGGWWLSQNTRSLPTQPEVSQESNAVLTQTKLLTWDDPAGFTFEYPDELSVNKHEEDQENYAHLELTHPKHEGKTIVWVKDLPLGNKKTPITTVDEWVANDKTLSSGNIVDTTLGDKTAKKVLLNGLDDLLITGVVYDDLLWLVEGQYRDKVYWSAVYKTVTDNFTFKLSLNTNQTGENSANDTPVDEEEVVE